MYKVFDTCGKFQAAFPTREAAEEYKIAMGRPDWRIKVRSSTERQRSAVAFCVETLGVPFNGNLNYFYDCSSYLDKYLNIAKKQFEDNEIDYREACESYYSEFMW